MLGVQRGSHIATVRLKYILHSYMDPLGTVLATLRAAGC